jgi:hypothetical protein
MRENFVQRAIKPRAAGNQNDGPALILEHFAKIAESRQVVRQVFNNVKQITVSNFVSFGNDSPFSPTV